MSITVIGCLPFLKTGQRDDMGNSLTEIAQQLKDSDKNVQLIYAFNGVGKTRLSCEFKHLMMPKNDGAEDAEQCIKFLYYNAFTEDLFYWDNDLDGDIERKFKIHPNAFTEWVLKEQGQDQNIINYFQHYTSDKLMPRFSEACNEVTFSLTSGDNVKIENIKISKGEESNFIWCVFYGLLKLVVDVLNVAELNDRDTAQFNDLKYVFIDDPVCSLDENHLIELAVDLASLIKSCQSTLKFIITTHNPLFYNVLYNELNSKDNRHNSYKPKLFEKYRLEKLDDGTYQLATQSNDSPFSYHLHLLSVLEQAISTGQIHKYHFNFLRNILEKTSTFLGHAKWGDLLPPSGDGSPNPYEARLINISSHSKFSGEEVTAISEDDKRVLGYLVRQINEIYHFKSGNR